VRARISGNARERGEIFGKCIDSSLYDTDSARMEAMAHVVVGTAGHIDHGKTSLVKALTGIDADRLKEEKERGITIDIGFASLRLDDETTIGFIDVPGHERFVKNMLAGIGGIDAVMLVIAADEAVMPQTREHLDICALLRVKRGLTVLTKIDTTERDIVDLAEMEVREYLRGSFLQDAPLLRVSSLTGEGIAALTAELRRLALEVAPRDASQIFRLPVDRCFTMKGFGTVVSGTLIAGRIRKDDEVEVLPVQRGARVRGIQVHGRSVDEARAGQRTALNLQRVELDEIERGMVLVPPDVFKPSATFDVEVELLPSAPGPIVRRKRVRFHVGTAEVMGYIVLLGRDVLEPGASAFAQIHLEQATFALPGDRFIVRQYSPMMTIGGGEIIDARPGRHRRADDSVPDVLRAFQSAPLDARVATLVEGAGTRAIDTAELVGRLGATPEQIGSALTRLAASEAVRVLQDAPRVVVSGSVFAAAAGAVAGAVAEFHAAEPLAKGIAREELRGRALRGASPLVFRAVLDDLASSRQLTVEQEIVRAHQRIVTLGDEEARIRTALEERYRALGLQAPAGDEIIRELGFERSRARKIIHLLVDEHVLVKVADDVFVDAAAIGALIGSVRRLKETNPRLGVREFKELTGLSRKFAMPLLEYLDGQRVTRRQGEDRVIL
jgi:selenocysteine-specific elongation factor